MGRPDLNHNQILQCTASLCLTIAIQLTPDRPVVAYGKQRTGYSEEIYEVKGESAFKYTYAYAGKAFQEFVQ